MANKTMQDASTEAEETLNPAEETTEETKEEEAPEETTTEEATEDGASEPQDQSAKDEDNADDGKSEEKPTDTTEVDFDPIAYVESLADEKLTPEQKQQLKDGYLRQADYTRKTQEVAQNKKIIDEYSTLKPYIQKIFNDEALYKQVFGGQSQPQPQKPEDQGEEIPDDPKEYAAWVKKQAVEEAKRDIMQDLQRQSQQAAMEKDIEQASKLDARLETDINFAKQIGGLVATDQDYIQGRKSATQATQDALEYYKQQSEAQRKQYAQEYQQKAKNKTMVFPQTKSGSQSAAPQSSRPSSMAEAAKMAEEELNR